MLVLILLNLHFIYSKSVGTLTCFSLTQGIDAAALTKMMLYLRYAAYYGLQPSINKITPSIYFIKIYDVYLKITNL